MRMPNLLYRKPRDLLTVSSKLAVLGVDTVEACRQLSPDFTPKQAGARAFWPGPERKEVRQGD
jgi:hypothetical protein